MAPYYEEYEDLVFGPEARRHRHTRIHQTSAPAADGSNAVHTWEVTQTLLDPEGDHLWHVLGTITLTPEDDLDGPLVEVLHIGK